jgi:hypothetical protein
MADGGMTGVAYKKAVKVRQSAVNFLHPGRFAQFVSGIPLASEGCSNCTTNSSHQMLRDLSSCYSAGK